eukprot:gene8459-11454_t
MDLGEEIDQLARKLPQLEIYNLSSQIRRAADSVALNIAEGSCATSNAEQASGPFLSRLLFPRSVVPHQSSVIGRPSSPTGRFLPMKQIPNIFTLFNLIFGCMAIVYLLQNGLALIDNPDGSSLISLQPEKMYLAPLFLALAAVVDFLDGFVARAIGRSSEMGKQLDSLADVVSFGVAPSIIIYQLLRLSLAKEEGGLEASMLWLAPAFVLAAAAAYRLAKFNLDTRQSYSFRGTPVPSVGLAVASFPLIYWTNNIDW